MATTSRARDVVNSASGRALVVLCGVLFLTFLDTTVVSVALGAVQADLHAGVIQLQWVINGYALVFAALMLTFGSIGDRIGRRRVMLTGIAVFAAGSLICATAPNVAFLIAGRAVMGVGAAACEPGTLSMIRHLYVRPAERARAIGVWTAVCGSALAAGPVIGGVLIGLTGGWRGIFWFNLVLGVALFGAVVRVVPESADPVDAPMDWAGFAMGTLALAALTEAIMEIGRASCRERV